MVGKIFEVLGCADEFKARLASYKLEGDALNCTFPGFVGKKVGPPKEQAKHFKWALYDWILDGIVNTEFTDVAQVANAARNIEILRERQGGNNNQKSWQNRDSVKREWSLVFVFFLSIACLLSLLKSLPELFELVMKGAYVCILGGIRGEIGVNTFRNAIRANYSNEYVVSPSLITVRPWFSSISVYEAMKPNQPKGPSFTDHIKAICNIDVPMESQAPTTSSKTEMKIKNLSPVRPRTKAQAIEANPGISTPNDFISEQQGMDEGTQNYSLDNIFIGTNPSVLVDKTKYAGDGLKTAHTDLGTNKESRSDEILKKITLKDLSNIMQDTRSAFLTPDSLQDEPIIVLDESEKEEIERYEDTHNPSHDGPEDTSIPHPSSPKSIQIQELMAQLTKLLVTSLKPKLSKLLASHDFANCLPTKLKELPSKITELFGDVKELKKHVRDMEIELPGDVKEIPKNMETFTSTISSLTSQVAELKTLQWELPVEFIGLPSQISPVQEKLKTFGCASNKSKEVMSSKDVEDEETESDSKDDHANPAETMTESSKQKKLKKFSFVTKGGEQIHLTVEKIEE
ncbi:hypothetical protein Tco_1254380 [Tanacetum coccineum]